MSNCSNVLGGNVFKVKLKGPGMVVRAFNPNTAGQRWEELCEFKDSLIFIASFKLGRATE